MAGAFASHDLLRQTRYHDAMTLSYPVASSPEQALIAPKGFALREREAAVVGGEEPVRFVSQWFGKAERTEAAARQALEVRLGAKGAEIVAKALSEGWGRVEAVALVEGAQPKRPATALVAEKPVYRNGRRWPAPQDRSHKAEIGWRLSVRFWRLGEDAPAKNADQARRVRRQKEAEELDALALKALAEQPLSAYSPQKALNIGLFEFFPPEAPHILMPDE